MRNILSLKSRSGEFLCDFRNFSTRVHVSFFNAKDENFLISICRNIKFYQIKTLLINLSIWIPIDAHVIRRYHWMSFHLYHYIYYIANSVFIEPWHRTTTSKNLIGIKSGSLSKNKNFHDAIAIKATKTNTSLKGEISISKIDWRLE